MALLKINLERDKWGFLVGDPSDCSDYLPFILHDSEEDSYYEIEDYFMLIDWSERINMEPKYDFILTKEGGEE